MDLARPVYPPSQPFDFLIPVDRYNEYVAPTVASGDLFECIQAINYEQKSEPDLAAKIKRWGLKDAVFGCRVVSILGSQSSGKSTLLNCLFGTNFDTMDETQRQQTTKGIWMSPSKGMNIVVIDVEGTDSRERRDCQDFDRKFALFCLAVSDVLIINIWENQVGLYQGSNMVLLRTIFEVNLDLFRKTVKDGDSRTLILFIIRDHLGSASLANLEATLTADLARIWESLSKPAGLQDRQLSDYFDLHFSTLPHKVLAASEFELEVQGIRERFLNHNHEGYIFRSMRHNSVPVNELAYYMQRIWEKIRTSKDLELPSPLELLAQFRCDEILRVISTGFNNKVKIIKLRIDTGIVVDGLGELMRKWRSYALDQFDQDASRYHQVVYQRKRADLLATFDSLFPLFLGQLNNLYKASLTDFEQKMQLGMSKLGYDFADLVSSVREHCECEFSKIAGEAMVGGMNWSWEDKMELLKNEVNKLVGKYRQVMMEKMVNVIKGNLEEAISTPLHDHLGSAAPNMWDKVLKVYQAGLQQAETSLKTEAVKSDYPFEETAKLLGAVQEHARLTFRQRVDQQTTDSVVLGIMLRNFKKLFLFDDNGMSRFKKFDDDIDGSFTSSRDQTLKFIQLYSRASPLDPSLEDIVSDFVVFGDDRARNLKTLFERDANSCWIEVKQKFRPEREEQIRKMIDTIKGNFQDMISSAVDSNLKAATPHMWDDVLIIYNRYLEQVKMSYSAKARSFNCTDEEIKELGTAVQERAWLAFSERINDQTTDSIVLEKSLKHFEKQFLFDEHGGPRFTKFDDNIDGFFVRARDQSLRYISLYSRISPSRQSLKDALPELVVFSDHRTQKLIERFEHEAEALRTEVKQKFRPEREGELMEMVDVVKRKLEEQISKLISDHLKKAAPNMWDEILKVYKDCLFQAEIFSRTKARSFSCTDEEMTNLVATVRKSAWLIFRERIDERTAENVILEKLLEEFKALFLFDESGAPRFKKFDDDIDGSFQNARDQTLGFISRYSIISPSPSFSYLKDDLPELAIFGEEKVRNITTLFERDANAIRIEAKQKFSRERDTEVKKMLNSVKRSLEKQVSKPVDDQLKKAAPNMWDEVLKIYKHHLHRAQSTSQTNARMFNCTDEEIDQLNSALQEHALLVLHERIDGHTTEAAILEILLRHFKNQFLYDEHGVPRFEQYEDDIDSCSTKARDQTEKLISLYSRISSSDPSLADTLPNLTVFGEEKTRSLSILFQRDAKAYCDEVKWKLSPDRQEKIKSMVDMLNNNFKKQISEPVYNHLRKAIQKLSSEVFRIYEENWHKTEKVLLTKTTRFHCTDEETQALVAALRKRTLLVFHEIVDEQTINNIVLEDLLREFKRCFLYDDRGAPRFKNLNNHNIDGPFIGARDWSLKRIPPCSMASPSDLPAFVVFDEDRTRKLAALFQDAVEGYRAELAWNIRPQRRGTPLTRIPTSRLSATAESSNKISYGDVRSCKRL